VLQHESLWCGSLSPWRCNGVIDIQFQGCSEGCGICGWKKSGSILVSPQCSSMASFDPRSEELEMCPQANVFAATSPSTSAQIKAFMRRGFSDLGDL
jgi:hypothetical protein